MSEATLAATIILSLFAGAVIMAKLTHRTNEKDINVSNDADDD